MKGNRNVFKWLDAHLEETIMIITAISITVVILFQIIMRYFFKNALPWPEEFSRFCYIYFVFMSIGYSIRNKSMLNVTMLQDFMPKRMRMLLDLVIQMLMAVIFGVFTYYSTEVIRATLLSGQKATALQIPMTIPYLATFLGFLTATFRSVQSTLLCIKQLHSKGNL
ncbi:TRAP transporter small permease [Clostridium transplantifaecale]|uniref:TRAP transporter small permease n=1 Tax=Clostridium transplantifaecale TaxID=2479838 RepID=UPI000F63CD6E|nr:TRAP transporter small permease [Clostridium transplantifaecale]